MPKGYGYEGSGKMSKMKSYKKKGKGGLMRKLKKKLKKYSKGKSFGSSMAEKYTKAKGKK